MQLKRLELLQRMPIFGGIREDGLEYLVEMARPCVVPGGHYFFREGDAAQGMYVLEIGRAAVLKNWQSRQFLLRHLEQGDCFGEMALIDLQPRSASVRALNDCTAIELTAGNLHGLYEQDAEQFTLIQMNIGRELSRRLRATDELLFRASMGEPSTPDEAGVLRST
jgi:CRP-like cAMP-binding protein